MHVAKILPKRFVCGLPGGLFLNLIDIPYKVKEYFETNIDDQSSLKRVPRGSARRQYAKYGKYYEKVSSPIACQMIISFLESWMSVHLLETMRL